jgi:hypothetical protein
MIYSLTATGSWSNTLKRPAKDKVEIRYAVSFNVEIRYGRFINAAPMSATGKHDRLRLKNELGANLMRRTRMACIIETLCVKGKTE